MILTPLKTALTPNITHLPNPAPEATDPWAGNWAVNGPGEKHAPGYLSSPQPHGYKPRQDFESPSVKGVKGEAFSQWTEVPAHPSSLFRLPLSVITPRSCWEKQRCRGNSMIPLPRQLQPQSPLPPPEGSVPSQWSQRYGEREGASEVKGPQISRPWQVGSTEKAPWGAVGPGCP